MFKPSIHRSKVNHDQHFTSDVQTLCGGILEYTVLLLLQVEQLPSQPGDLTNHILHNQTCGFSKTSPHNVLLTI